MKHLGYLAGLGLAVGTAWVLVSREPAPAEIVTFPEEISQDCRRGRAVLYDECGSQVALFKKALAAANDEDKTLLVSYGAEWCIWCHVFDQYVNGEHTRLNYRYGDPGSDDYETVAVNEHPDHDPSAEADELRQLFAANFVLVHIENLHSPDGKEVLESTGAIDFYNGGIPFIFSVDAQGIYAAHVESSEMETRRDDPSDPYRGYDRGQLINALEEIRSRAASPSL